MGQSASAEIIFGVEVWKSDDEQAIWDRWREVCRLIGQDEADSLDDEVLAYGLGWRPGQKNSDGGDLPAWRFLKELADPKTQLYPDVVCSYFEGSGETVAFFALQQIWVPQAERPDIGDLGRDACATDPTVLNLRGEGLPDEEFLQAWGARLIKAAKECGLECDGRAQFHLIVNFG